MFILIVLTVKKASGGDCWNRNTLEHTLRGRLQRSRGSTLGSSFSSALESSAVFAFGVCAAPSDKFERIAQPGIHASQEPDSLVMVLRGERPIFARIQPDDRTGRGG